MRDKQRSKYGVKKAAAPAAGAAVAKGKTSCRLDTARETHDLRIRHLSVLSLTHILVRRALYGCYCDRLCTNPRLSHMITSGESVAKDHENTVLMVNKATLLGASTTPGGVEEVSMNYTRSVHVCVCVCVCICACIRRRTQSLAVVLDHQYLFRVSSSVVPFSFRCHFVETCWYPEKVAGACFLQWKCTL